jgi:hypothetical protein
VSEKLTPAMKAALEEMLTPYVHQSIRFQTGEALRRRGLADRLSTYVIKREYVTRDDVTPQFPKDVSAKNPVVWHEWYITQEGKWALQAAKTEVAL